MKGQAAQREARMKELREMHLNLETRILDIDYISKLFARLDQGMKVHQTLKESPIKESYEKFYSTRFEKFLLDEVQHLIALLDPEEESAQNALKIIKESADAANLDIAVSD